MYCGCCLGSKARPAMMVLKESAAVKVTKNAGNAWNI